MPILPFTNHNAPDPIFFRKEDIHKGTRFICVGRTAPANSTWTVQKITTWISVKPLYVPKNRRSRYISNAGGYFEDIPTARHLSDIVTLYNPATGETRELTIGYISYSAIWRLAP